MSKIEQFRSVSSWVRTHWLLSAIAGAVLLVLVVYFAAVLRDWNAHRSVVKQDQQLEQKASASETKAATSESNANTLRDSRQAAEGRADQAWKEKEQAAQNSNRSAEEVRKARTRYDETRRTRPADSPALSDADLCAELAKRGIPCN